MFRGLAVPFFPVCCTVFPASSFPHRLSSTVFPALSFLHRLSRTVFPASSFPHRLSRIVFPAPSFPHRLSCIVFPASSFLHRLSCTVFPAPSFPHRLSCVVFPAPSFLHCLSSTVSPPLSLPHRLSCTVSPAFLSSLFRGLFPRCATPTFLLSLSLHSLSCSSSLPFLGLFSSGHLSSFPYGLPCCLRPDLGAFPAPAGDKCLPFPCQT